MQRSGVDNWLYLADWYGEGTKRLLGSHLACFHAGNFIYVSTSGPFLFSTPELIVHGTKGGRLLDNQTVVDFGLELNEGCWNTYGSSP
jgi:mannosyl-oligosaccharide alpha-1,2-mannosidase